MLTGIRYAVAVSFWLVVLIVFLAPEFLREPFAAMKSLLGLGRHGLAGLFLVTAWLTALVAIWIDRRNRLRAGIWSGWLAWLTKPDQSQLTADSVLLLRWIAMAVFVTGLCILALFD